jgi:hypothetical protein
MNPVPAVPRPARQNLVVLGGFQPNEIFPPSGEFQNSRELHGFTAGLGDIQLFKYKSRTQTHEASQPNNAKIRSGAKYILPA